MSEAALLIALVGITAVGIVVVLLDSMLAPDPDSETWEQ